MHQYAAAASPAIRVPAVARMRTTPVGASADAEVVSASMTIRAAVSEADADALAEAVSLADDAGSVGCGVLDSGTAALSAGVSGLVIPAWAPGASPAGA
jgi:hypothetical protein